MAFNEAKNNNNNNGLYVGNIHDFSDLLDKNKNKNIKKNKRKKVHTTDNYRIQEIA